MGFRHVISQDVVLAATYNRNGEHTKDSNVALKQLLLPIRYRAERSMTACSLPCKEKKWRTLKRKWTLNCLIIKKKSRQERASHPGMSETAAIKMPG
jgi:hypothetical protein